jgi:hypothetical protein
LATHEDLIGHGLTHTRPAVLVGDLEQRRGPLGSSLGPAAEFGNAGGALAENDLQEAVGHGQADPDGLGRGGELGLAILVKDNGVVKAALQVVTAGLGLFELLAKVEGNRAVRLCVEIVADGVAVSVDGLAAESVFGCQACNRAVASEESGGGAGNALGKG